MIEEAQMNLKSVTSAKAPKAIGPYSPALRAGGTLFLSGQLGIDPATGELEKGVRSQAERALANMEAILAEEGLSFASVAKTTIFLADMADFATVNEVYASRFSAPYPARSTIQVAALPKGALVEIEGIAIG
jgi:2-iminobutanoate/2-iminopropanoate deaminase